MSRQTIPSTGNRFAQPGPLSSLRPPWESPSWQDPFDTGGYTGDMNDPNSPVGPESFLGPPQWRQPEPLDPFSPDMNYDFGYGV